MTQQLPDNLFLEAIKASVPNLKTQAQFNSFMAAFDALRMTLNCTFGGDGAGAEKGKDALLQALDVAEKITSICDRLREVPDASTSPEAAQFTAPPKEFHEHDVQKRLLLELERVRDYDEMCDWYERSKPRRDAVVSPLLRNVLMDAIRDKRTLLKG